MTILELSTVAPRPGDDVIVMGYPTGIHALLARVDEKFVDELNDEGEANFWSVGRRLSKGNHIRPLATRGIVGQVTAAAVVYDAETAQGGSGGPVLGRAWGFAFPLERPVVRARYRMTGAYRYNRRCVEYWPPDHRIRRLEWKALTGVTAGVLVDEGKIAELAAVKQAQYFIFAHCSGGSSNCR